MDKLLEQPVETVTFGYQCPDCTSNQSSKSSLTLNQISLELDRCTKESQRLQEVVENATEWSLGAHISGLFNVGSGLGELAHNKPFTTDPNQQIKAPGSLKFSELSEYSEFENEMNGCIQQLEIFEINEPSGQQDTFREPLADMLTELQKVQMNKNLSEFRLKDSENHVEEMEKMLHLLEEVQIAKLCGDQMLQKTEEEVLKLNRKIATLEKMLPEHHTQCSLEEHWRHYSNYADDESLRLFHPPAPQNNFNKEEEQPDTNKLPRHQECVGVNNEECVVALMDYISQEMAVLSDKLSSSTSSSASCLAVKLQLLKKLVEKQLLYDAQVFELRKTLSDHEKRFNFLEEHLTCLQANLLNAQGGKIKLVKQPHKPKNSLKEKKDMDVLKGRLTVALEQLQRAEEEKTCLQALLENRAQEESKSQELLANKKVELKLKQQESEQHMTSITEARDQCQKLHKDKEALMIKLQNYEKINETLRFQLKHNIQQAVQCCGTSKNLHQEILLLTDQINDLKVDILQLQADLEHYKSNLAAVEHEMCKLQASEAEHGRRVQEEILAKQQLSIKLEKQGTQLLSLTEEHKELQLLYSCMNKEKEGVVLQLQSHLKNVQTELDQARSTLRTLEQKDNQGLQMAQSMQKKITDRRKQIDFLQSRIQNLEQTKEKLCQEKLHQNFKNKRLFQELALVKTEKKHLVKELEAVKSRDQYLRKRISELEAVLHKIYESFAGCQECIQLQEYYHLKLKHTLGLKQDSPFLDVGSLLFKEQHEVKKHRPHTVNITDANSVCRRGSTPKRVQSTACFTDKTDKVLGGTQLERKASRSESHHLKAFKLKETVHHNQFIQEPLTSTPSATMASLQLVGRRSPVHTLLTSNPNS
ncbi:coiled-coil domain-containing protein 158 isoform X3 [Boleophthalmus pectinirostris]|uniref:coiled-coil domain-containing protein 158 isoform X3 n=1 Tax=Boleophthalmus pectinirostris TaxID=150288 RepID=UPI00242CF453|nr:coiled-coil domain-containing protein 158 isoform X3 [Boleophthalmus pectinirostris]